MFIALLFIKAKKCKQHKCSPTDEWIYNMQPHGGILFSNKKGMMHIDKFYKLDDP